MGTVLKLLRILLLAAAAVAILCIALLAVLPLFDVSIDVSRHKSILESNLGKALNSRIEIHGMVRLHPSFQPGVEIRGLSVEGNDDKGAVIGKSKVNRIFCRIALLPLLSRRIHFLELGVNGAKISLPESGSGVIKTKAVKGRKSAEAKDAGLSLIALDRLLITDSLIYKASDSPGGGLRFYLKEIKASARPERNIVGRVSGSLQGNPFDFKVSAPPLIDLLQNTKPFSIKTEGDLWGSGFNILLEHKPDRQTFIEFSAKSIDLGKTLSLFGAPKKVTAKAGSLWLKVELPKKPEGRPFRPQDISIMGWAKKGTWNIRPHEDDSPIRIGVEHCELKMPRGGRFNIALTGDLNHIPLKMKYRGEDLAGFIDPSPTPLIDIEAEIAGSKLAFKRLTQGLKDRSRPMYRLKAQGEKLSNLNPILKTTLPDWGDYELTCDLVLPENRFELANLDARIGQSRLKGSMSIDTAAKPMRLDMNFNSERLQLNDFFKAAPKTAKKPFRIKKKEKTNAANQKTPALQKEPPQKDSLPTLLGHQALNSIQGSISLSIDETLSGRDHLGAAKLRAKLESGRLDFDQLWIKVPGGEMNLAAHFQPTTQYLNMGLKVLVINFDYGILARRSDPESKANGKFSLDLNISTKAKDKKGIMANADGYLDFSFKPKEMPGDAFDLWAVNLLNFILDILNPKKQSKINCMVGKFHIKNGVMRQEKLILDTSALRINGEAVIDFPQQKISVILTPRAKTPQFFSLETPVRIQSDFKEFESDIAPGGILGTGLNILTSPIHIPLRRLLGDVLPTEGEDVCADPLGLIARYTKKKAPPKKQAPAAP